MDTRHADYVGWAFMPTRLFSGTDVGLSIFRLPLGQNAWATSAHPTLPKAFCKKQKPNDAVADTREWTHATPIA